MKRNLNNNSKREPSRGRVFYNRLGGTAPKLQFRARSVTVVKNTSGSGSLGFELLFEFLLNILPLCLFFSYWPVISLGANETMNFELSLPLLWLVVFDLVGIFLMGRKKLLFEGLKRKWVWLLLPVWMTLSVIWSLNVTRGVLTVGIMWLIYLAGYAMYSLRELFDREFWRRWLKWLFGATLVVCVWCVVQCILDLSGVGREYSLMCAGCTYRMFGFSHPNGFAIEPQFMGNLLLAPAMVAAWLIIMKQNGKNSKREPSRGRVFYNRLGGTAPKLQFRARSVTVVKNTSGLGFLCFEFLPLCFFVIATTLFLTFSRGAIYAFLVGMVFLTTYVMVRGWAERRKVLRRVGVVWLTVVVSFLIGLTAQGVMAELSPTNDTFGTGVAKVLNHLSLGVIDVRGDEAVEKPVENSEENRVGEVVEPQEVRSLESGKEEAVFDGYVAESTDTRVRLTGAALEIWRKDLKTVAFGVGIGGAGQALYDNGLSPAPKEIVQNEYASLLLETGVIGICLLIFTIWLIVRVVAKSRVAGMVLALLVAYGVSLCFFSGLANALQIYLMPMVLVVLGGGTVKNNVK